MLNAGENLQLKRVTGVYLKQYVFKTEKRVLTITIPSKFLTASSQMADVHVVILEFVILDHQESFLGLLVVAFGCLCL
jgi:hypothetical protein